MALDKSSCNASSGDEAEAGNEPTEEQEEDEEEEEEEEITEGEETPVGEEAIFIFAVEEDEGSKVQRDEDPNEDVCVAVRGNRRGGLWQRGRFIGASLEVGEDSSSLRGTRSVSCAGVAGAKDGAEEAET